MAWCDGCGAVVDAAAANCAACGATAPALPPPPVPGPAGRVPPPHRPTVASIVAEPWRRVASWAIDASVVVVAVALVSAINGVLGAIAFLVGAPAYYLVLVGHQRSGTLGHRLLGLQVIDERTGRPVDEQRAALRFAVGVALLVPFALPMIGSVRALATHDRHRAWHDLASQTMVTRT